MDNQNLITLFNWTEVEFLRYTEGSAIRRICYEQWVRNVAVALGNAPFDPAILEALKRRDTAGLPMAAEHIEWAIEQQWARARGFLKIWYFGPRQATL